MEKIFIYIKHNLRFLWKIIDRLNSILFTLLYRSKMNKSLEKTLKEVHQTGYTYRRLLRTDADALYRLLKKQIPEDLAFFHPHDFDSESIKRQFGYGSFLMMGVFKGDNMTGYFFLRFFANRKCFVGRLIDKDFRGQGLGEKMNFIMYETAWKMGFRCLSTISQNNRAVMKAHSKNRSLIILKKLQNDYLLVEFVKAYAGD
jgi:hypothetical protein